MKIKPEKGHEKIDPAKPVFKKKAEPLEGSYIDWLVNRLVKPSYLKWIS